MRLRIHFELELGEPEPPAESSENNPGPPVNADPPLVTYAEPVDDVGPAGFHRSRIQDPR